MKVAIYSRVSTEDQNPEIQQKICEEYCKRMNWGIHASYMDVSSGAKSSRPEFNMLLADMRSMKFNVIVVTKLDRMGRSLKHLLSIFDEIKNKGVHFVAVQQNIDTSTAQGGFFMHILGAFAEFERELISERTKDGLRNAVNVGKRGPDKKPRKKRGALRKPGYL